MTKKAASRKDVAELAGVTETIVSYVLNGNRYVKKEKREAVLKAIKELNYRPNRFARALHGLKTKHIMLLIDRISSEAFGLLINEIERCSGNQGYLCSVAVIENATELVDRIIEWRVDGVIISSIHFDNSSIQKLVDAHVAVVILENRDYPDIPGTLKINTGLYEGISTFVEMMNESGCREIIYVDRISKNGHFSNMSDFRYRGYCDTADKLGIEKRIITNCYSPEQLGDRLMDEMRKRPFDGVACRNDDIACIVMNVLQREGVVIPDQVSITGMDNTTYSRFSNPRLTSYCVNREKIAELAVDFIDKADSNDRGLPVKYSLDPIILVRDSIRKKA